MRLIAIRCMCQVFVKRPTFNFSKNIVGVLIPLLSVHNQQVNVPTNLPLIYKNVYPCTLFAWYIILKWLNAAIILCAVYTGFFYRVHAIHAGIHFFCQVLDTICSCIREVFKQDKAGEVSLEVYRLIFHYSLHSHILLIVSPIQSYPNFMAEMLEFTVIQDFFTLELLRVLFTIWPLYMFDV